MKTLLLIPMLLMLVSCGTMSNLSESIAKGREIVNELHDTYDELRGELAELKGELKELDRDAFLKADKDEDGELDWLERLTYLLLLGGGSMEVARRKINQMKAKKAAEAEAEAEAEEAA